MSHREPNEEPSRAASPPLLQLAVALILVRMCAALTSAWLLNPVTTRNEALAFSAVVLVFSIVGAVFVWQRRRWAAWLVIAITGLDVVLNLFSVTSSLALLAALVFAEVTGIVLIATLLRREVWSLFR